MDERQSNVIFETVHGSHLYGFAHAESDHDRFTVTDSRRKARHTVNGDDDHVRVGLYRFLELAQGGSHQSVEALFSPEKVWHDERFRPLIEGVRVTGSDVFAKYERTIKAFSYGDFKRRRHAARLWINLRELRAEGVCSPRLTPVNVEWCNTAASLQDDDLVGFLLGPKGR